MVVIIDDKDVENLVFLEGNWGTYILHTWKGRLTSFFKKLYGMGVSNGSRA